MGLHLERNRSFIILFHIIILNKFTKTKINRTLVAKNNCDVRLKRNERTIIP